MQMYLKLRKHSRLWCVLEFPVVRTIAGTKLPLKTLSYNSYVRAIKAKLAMNILYEDDGPTPKTPQNLRINKNQVETIQLHNRDS